MSNDNKISSAENIRSAYAAIADYHTSLVQMRFTIVGLFLAANGFLAVGFFQPSSSVLPQIALPIIAIILTLLSWILEVRTYHLLENLAMRGLELEKLLCIHYDQGFFSLINHQPIGKLLIPTRIRLPEDKDQPTLFTHSFGISLIYLIIGVFWIILLFLHM